MEDTFDPRQKKPMRPVENPRRNTRKATNAPVWTFEQKENGLFLASLGGGSRKITLYLYPAEMDALKKACAYDLWADDV